MELQENSNGYTYKDGLLTSDIFSFVNANGQVLAGEDRTHWATMGMYAKRIGITRRFIFWNSVDVMTVLPVLLREIAGDCSLLSQPVMTFLVPTISKL